MIKFFGFELWVGRMGNRWHVDLWRKHKLVAAWHPNATGKRFYIRGLDWLINKNALRGQMK